MISTLTKTFPFYDSIKPGNVSTAATRDRYAAPRDRNHFDLVVLLLLARRNQTSPENDDDRRGFRKTQRIGKQLVPQSLDKGIPPQNTFNVLLNLRYSPKTYVVDAKIQFSENYSAEVFTTQTSTNLFFNSHFRRCTSNHSFQTLKEQPYTSGPRSTSPTNERANLSKTRWLLSR